MSSPNPHEPHVMEVTSPQKVDTRDTENYCPVHLSEYPRLLLMSHMLIPSVLNETTYPITLICSGWLSSCTNLTTRPPGDTENYDLIHCPFTNRHETALLPYPISNTAPYTSLVLNASPRTALPYPPEGTTMNVGQLRFI